MILHYSSMGKVSLAYIIPNQVRQRYIAELKLRLHDTVFNALDFIEVVIVFLIL